MIGSGKKSTKMRPMDVGNGEVRFEAMDTARFLLTSLMKGGSATGRIGFLGR
jgi:hypothetical protein